jgi:hypothetical protein
MKIIIPTKGRVSQQTTLANLPKELHPQVVIVAPSTEFYYHQKNWPNVTVVQQTDDRWDIATKRQWIVESSQEEKIVMLDDDLRFAVRRTDDPGKFVKATLLDVSKAFTELEALLSEDFPHAGFSARGGGINDAAKRGGWQMGKRMMYVLGYHLPTVRKHAIFGRIKTHEDMDICLQLLSKGFPNLVNFSFVVDQKFGSAGGCTSERTVEKNNADVELLAQLHPKYVRITEKAYTSSTPRKEVVCAWQRCLQEGQFGE